MRLKNSGVYAVDVAGLGGTHWGRVEGLRAPESDPLRIAAQVFADWGHGTLQSLLAGGELQTDYKLWASGGVRSGLDAAKLLAVGAEQVGIAQPLLQAALHGEENLLAAMTQFEMELKTAMFCTGCENLDQFRRKKVYQWI